MSEHWQDDTELEDPLDPLEERDGAAGGILAIVLLIVAILLLVFLFREELGLGTPTAQIAMPERIEVDEPTSQVIETAPENALDETP